MSRNRNKSNNPLQHLDSAISKAISDFNNIKNTKSATEIEKLNSIITVLRSNLGAGMFVSTETKPEGESFYFSVTKISYYLSQNETLSLATFSIQESNDSLDVISKTLGTNSLSLAASHVSLLGAVNCLGFGEGLNETLVTNKITTNKEPVKDSGAAIEPRIETPKNQPIEAGLESDNKQQGKAKEKATPKEDVKDTEYSISDKSPVKTLEVVSSEDESTTRISDKHLKEIFLLTNENGCDLSEEATFNLLSTKRRAGKKRLEEISVSDGYYLKPRLKLALSTEPEKKEKREAELAKMAKARLKFGAFRTKSKNEVTPPQNANPSTRNVPKRVKGIVDKIQSRIDSQNDTNINSLINLANDHGLKVSNGEDVVEAVVNNHSDYDLIKKINNLLSDQELMEKLA